MKKLLINLEISVNDSLEVTNVKVIKSKEIKNTTDQKEHLILDDNKITLNEEALTLLEASPGDRLFIYYEISDTTDFVPMITKSSNTKNSNQGNLLKKDWSMVFKGQPKTVLASHGTTFNLIKCVSSYENSYKLVTVTEASIEEPKFDKIIGTVPII